MKQLTFLSILTFILTACGTNSFETKHVVTKPVIDPKQTFKSILNGNWYQSSYIDSIQETKSPFRSQDALEEMVELDIDTTDIKGDSLEVGAPSIHEGTSFIVFFKPGLKSTSLPTNINRYNTGTNFYELGYNISAVDTSLILYIYNKNKKVIHQTKYLKASKNSEGALQYIVNKTLFAGNYQAEDSSGKMSLLKFTNDGQVVGLPSYKKYYLLTDFVAESEDRFDQVCFDINTKNQRRLGFSIVGDTIKLFEVKEGLDSSQLGELKYRLVRQ
jgi:hypothetical protein